MRRIVMFCAMGLTSGMIVKKMKEYAKEIGYDCEIEAYNQTMAKEKIPGADVVLLGPQIRFAEKNIRKFLPENTPLILMNMREYGTQQADFFVEQVRETLGDKEEDKESV